MFHNALSEAAREWGYEKVARFSGKGRGGKYEKENQARKRPCCQHSCLLCSTLAEFKVHYSLNNSLNKKALRVRTVAAKSTHATEGRREKNDSIVNTEEGLSIQDETSSSTKTADVSEY